MTQQLTNKLKILYNPSKKSAHELLKDITAKGYDCVVENKQKTILTINKKNVPLSLNAKKHKNPFEQNKIKFIIQEALNPQEISKVKCESCGNLRGIERRKGNYSTCYCDDCYINLNYAFKGAI